MAIEEKENQELTKLQELIDLVGKDPLPTNVFTIEDTDSLVLLGKLNKIEECLRGIKNLIVDINSNSIEAVNTALDAIKVAKQALDGSNTALAAVNTALETANQAITTANTSLEQATDANNTAGDALIHADDAKQLAQTAMNKAQEALDHVTQGLGTKVYDIHDTLLSTAKFAGHNGINVDMAENDPQTFDIRLDNTITTAIEDTHQQIVELTEMLASVEEDVDTKLIKKADYPQIVTDLQNDNVGDIYTDTSTHNNYDEFMSAVHYLKYKTYENGAPVEKTKTIISPFFDKRHFWNKKTSMGYTAFKFNDLSIYPLGIIIAMSTTDDPANLIGGYWQRIKGVFLWGCDNNERPTSQSVDGGSKTPALLRHPGHSTGLDENENEVYFPFESNNSYYLPSKNLSKYGTNRPYAAFRGNESALRVFNVGLGDQSTGNMPPYKKVYYWKRIQDPNII